MVVSSVCSFLDDDDGHAVHKHFIDVVVYDTISHDGTADDDDDDT